MRTFADKGKATQPTKFDKTSSVSRSHVGQDHDPDWLRLLQRIAEDQAVHQPLENKAEQRDVGLSGLAPSQLGHDVAQAPARSPQGNVIQTKLAINAPGDKYEQEADHIADQVIRRDVSPRDEVSFKGSGNKAQTPPSVQTQQVGPGDLRLNEAPSNVHDVLRSPGQPLDTETRADMEYRFRRDFSRVRLHSGVAAEQSAQIINARAYTVGQNIVFGRGQFTPKTHEGQRLLAHELVHTIQQSSGAPAGVARQPMEPRHARGFAGEQGMGFTHYPQEDGWIFFEGPSGSAGHGITESGFDGVAYNVRTGETHLVDNKSLARPGNVGSATAVDPSRNLGKNLDGLIQRVEAAKDVPGRIGLLSRLRALKASLAAGKPLPPDVKLVVTGVGGQSTGVTGRLQSQGVEFRPEPTPKSLPPTAASTKPPATPSPEPPVAAAPKAPTITTESPKVPVAVKPTAPSPAAPTPVVEGNPVPVVTPPIRPTGAWKAGLKAGGKAALVMLLFAGLDYYVHKRLAKELEESIDQARHGAMPWAQRLKREDPTKPVYMRVKVESKDYSTYIPLGGWLPDAPVLHMIQIMMVREEIDPPIVEEQDHRLNPFHPGVTTTVTYTELMVP